MALPAGARDVTAALDGRVLGEASVEAGAVVLRHPLALRTGGVLEVTYELSRDASYTVGRTDDPSTPEENAR
jgi:hypothetical protein